MGRLPLSLREALRGVFRYPLRSTLALLALAVGVGSVVGTVALLDASRRLALEGLLRFGALDVVRVAAPEAIWREGRQVPIAKRGSLLPEDVDRFRQAIPWLRGATLHASQRGQVKGPAGASDAEIEASSPDLPEFFPIDVEEGRFLRREDGETLARVAVLTPALVAELFGAHARKRSRVAHARQSKSRAAGSQQSSRPFGFAVKTRPPNVAVAFVTAIRL